MAEALYNKYRPQIFEDVVGQEHIERTLKNAIASDKISHAYMFTGPRGTGKTTTARLLAKALLCESGPTPDPDGSCEDCLLVANGEHPDVYELDAASRTGVENVREEIIGKVNYAPTRGRYKVYIIDEVHMLSTAAFNALLKTLEEPPSHVVFVLCTTDPQKVPETIQSRCQRFDFRRISSEELISRLGAICEMEGVSYEGDALDLIAHRAQGGMRDALTSLEQLVAFGEGAVTTELAERLLGALDSSDLADIVRSIGERDAAACFRWTSEYMETGADLVQFVQDLTKHMRDMYVMSLAGADVALEVTEAGRRELQTEMRWYGPDRLARMLGVLGDLANELKTSTNQRLSFEIALTRMVRPESDLTLEALAQRIEQLERGQASVPMAGAQPSGSGAAASTRQNAAETAPLQSEPAKHLLHPSHPNTPDGDSAAAASASLSEPINSKPPEPEYAPPASNEPEAGPLDAAHKLDLDAAPSSTLSPSGSIDAEQLWPTALAHLKKIGPAYNVVFLNTRATIEDGRLVIAFDPESNFAFKAAQKQDARQALEKALARAGVQGLAYEIVQSSTPLSRPSGQAQSQPAPQQSYTQPGERPEQQLPQANAPQQAQAPQQPPFASAAQERHPFEQESQQPNTQEQSHAPKDDARIPAEPLSSNLDECSDPDFSDFITSAFGENVVIEEITE